MNISTIFAARCRVLCGIHDLCKQCPSCHEYRRRLLDSGFCSVACSILNSAVQKQRRLVGDVIPLLPDQENALRGAEWQATYIGRDIIKRLNDEKNQVPLTLPCINPISPSNGILHFTPEVRMWPVSVFYAKIMHGRGF